ncbi:MAG TPA: hypothetical protein VGK54_04965 [Chloroflexota bacterium]|jgi:hypothetical protein
MSRGLLDETTLNSINAALPDALTRLDRVLPLSPDVITMKFPRDSDVPIAAVCFVDAAHTLAGVRHALFEFHAHGIYYREKTTPPEPMAAVWFERYYADDVALRLYSAAEHIANALVFMFQIPEAQLKPFRKPARTSLQSVVGHFLLKTKKSLPVSKTLKALAGSKSWNSTVTYRNEWVHAQPPTIYGLGFLYHRKKRWKTTSDGSFYLGVGGGDTPKYTTAQLVAFIEPAFQLLLKTFDACVDAYLDILASRGIALSGSELSTKL